MKDGFVAYQKMAGRYAKFWCNSHKREADHIALNGYLKRVIIKCNPHLGGILLPCDCVPLESRT